MCNCDCAFVAGLSPSGLSVSNLSNINKDPTFYFSQPKLYSCTDGSSVKGGLLAKCLAADKQGVFIGLCGGRICYVSVLITFKAFLLG